MNSQYDFLKGLLVGGALVFIIFQFVPGKSIQHMMPDSKSQVAEKEVQENDAENAKPSFDSSITHSRTRGSSNPKVRIVEYSDFRCPYCRRVSGTLKKIFEDYKDKVQWSFMHMPLVLETGKGSFPIHEAVACAEEQGKFWEFYEAAFEGQSAPSNESIQEIASNLGLDVEGFNQCLNEHRYAEEIIAEAKKGHEIGVQGTPTFFIDGIKVVGPRSYDYFAALIDPEYKAEGQKIESRVQKINEKLDGRPSIGPDDAPVIIEEFSDFHCGFCKRMSDVFDEILELEEFKGKVKRVWRHNPLPFHKYAPGIHLGSECAHDQGKFWEFHHLVFEKPQDYRVKDDLNRAVEELGLDKEAFEACLTAEDTRKKIENDLALGYKRRVGGTPTLFVNGAKFVGYRKADAMKRIIGGFLGMNTDEEETVESGTVPEESPVKNEVKSETEELQQ